MDNAASTATRSVLTVDAVKWAIAALSQRRIHPHVLAYLQLRRRAVATSTEPLQPSWSDLRPLLEVPGGPPKKPNYRPLWSSIDNDGSAYWFNGNLAGSYAVSSIRNTAGFLVESGHYALPADHAEKALAALLYGKPAPALAMGAYFLRNYTFHTDGEPNGEHVVAGFRKWFLLNDDDEFAMLFEAEVPDVTFAWFEPDVVEDSTDE